MCQNTATANDAYISAEEARNEFFAKMYNVHFTHEKIRCHLVKEHGPKVSKSEMTRLAAKKGINSKFYSERALWGARHMCCAMHADKLAECAKSFKNGQKIAFTIDCANLFDTPVGVGLYANGKTTHMVDEVTIVYKFDNGSWYELTGFPDSR